MRRIIILSVLIVLAAVSSAFGDASLYRGTGSIGTVQTLENSSGLYVSVEEVGRIFGFTSSRSGEELLLTRGGTQLRVMTNSAAAWKGFTIVPLSSSPFERNGKIWLDAQSAASLFQSFAGSGSNNRLHFSKNVSAPVQRAVQAASTPVPVVKPASLPVTQPQTPKAAETPETPKPAVKPASLPETQPPAPKPAETPETPKPAVKPASLPVTQTPAPKAAETPETPKPAVKPASLPETQSQTPKAAETPKPSQAVTQTVSTPAVASTPAKSPEVKAAVSAPAKSSGTSRPAKKQPRLQTFRPGGKKRGKDESYSGSVKVIRWTHSDGAYNKVMAVVEADENADPQVYISGGSIHALFSECPENTEGLTSPYSNVKAEINRSDKGVELVFTPTGMEKAEKLVLNNPRRIAFDFFFPDGTAITSTDSPQPKAAQTPRQAPAVPAVTPQAQTARPRSPAVTTPPSTITIPMTAAGSRKLKTVVIDPGHGGKDPGASDNGVIEKNITLGVSRELQKILTVRGIRVVMTRNGDTYPTLQDRTDLANKENADLFVSVHVNALPSRKSASGFEIYIMALPTDKDAMNLAKVENREYVEGKGMDVANVDRRTEMLLKILGDMQQNNKISESTDFAAALYNAGVTGGLPMKRIAQAPFFVLRGAGMPAVLLEIGFLTNVTEARLLSDPAYQQKIADAMAAGIINYLK